MKPLRWVEYKIRKSSAEYHQNRADQADDRWDRAQHLTIAGIDRRIYRKIAAKYGWEM